MMRGSAKTASQSMCRSRAMKMRSTMGLSRRTAVPLNSETANIATTA
jgi:hypothetical protein